MTGNEEKPPDKGGGEIEDMDVDPLAAARKRLAAARTLAGSSTEEAKKKVNNTENAFASISTTYKHPSLESGSNSVGYGEDDCGPFIVHVSRSDTSASPGISLQAIKIGLLLVQNNIKNVVKGGIKSLGRNRVSVEFKSATDANSFLLHSFLPRHKLAASIPSYNVSRMGIVRGVPTEWSMEDFVNATDLKEGRGKILKARRLQRKVFRDDGTPNWVPTQSVVLTFEGQTLPKHIYAFYTSLIVEVYQLPTIQCRKCLRFGHIQKDCRSDARCYKCTKNHPGDDCNLAPEKSSCLFCSGRHFATDKSCPEFSRQKTIKVIMSQESISYAEASARIPAVRRPYSDAAKNRFDHIFDPPQVPFSPQYFTSPQSTPPKTPSYQKLRSPRSPRFPRGLSPLSQGYDQAAHREIVSPPPSQVPNGCALTDTAPNDHRLMPNEDLLELALKIVTNIIAKFSDVLPHDVAPAMIKLTKSLASVQYGPPAYSIPSVEL